MSYCRFSSDNFRSDVYVYEAADGFVTHVAATRLVFAEPLPANPIPDPRRYTSAESLDAAWDCWLDLNTVRTDIIEHAGREPIGLPHVGESFVDQTPGECADRLSQLASIGYRVPAGVIESLREEQADLNPSPA